MPVKPQVKKIKVQKVIEMARKVDKHNKGDYGHKPKR